MFGDILSIVPRTSWYTNKRIMQALNSVSFRADGLASIRLGRVVLLLLLLLLDLVKEVAKNDSTKDLKFYEGRNGQSSSS